jgi:hypothetical protein
MLAFHPAMSIVVWNCKMGLSSKRRRLYDPRADIAVIPECSQNCLKLCLKDGFEGRWFGDLRLRDVRDSLRELAN